jgi:hypothetical protein
MPDDTVTVSSNGDAVTVDARDVVVVDDRGPSAAALAATVSLQVSWKGSGRQRRLSAPSPAFAGQFFRRVRVRGTFSAAEEGLAFASDPRRRPHVIFAELGTEQNGIFLSAVTSCPRCGAAAAEPWREAAGLVRFGGR